MKNGGKNKSFAFIILVSIVAQQPTNQLVESIVLIYIFFVSYFLTFWPLALLVEIVDRVSMVHLRDRWQ